ncbi:hypothetical protein [Aestuariispira ectoiniformans]|uniref:hypothetical protein n=1 Tax=Aestuariispira ectoiniformans TaxID=2775080 RepID=UPI00223B292C|nr:hypothetical protein [Aestuariispira ectoiniformans]
MNGEKTISQDNYLMNAIKESLEELETSGDIVICSTTANIPARLLCDRLSSLVPFDKLSTSELIGLRALVVQAIGNKRFFDWEMPTLTGFKAEEFERIAEKLPKG